MFVGNVNRIIGVGDGGQGARVPPKIREKFFGQFSGILGKNHVKLGNFVNFSGKNHVKFGQFINF